MKRKLEINVKKIMMIYLIGLTSSIFMPDKYYFSIMNKLHKKINDSIEVEDKVDFYKIL